VEDVEVGVMAGFEEIRNKFLGMPLSENKGAPDCNQVTIQQYQRLDPEPDGTMASTKPLEPRYMVW
jgi:hypothetical protein